jgi:hypothetical protein
MSTAAVVVSGMCIGAGVLMLRGGLRTSLVQRGRKPRLHTKSTKASPKNRDLVEAVAIWTEQLRDTISAATGLEQAILATEHHAPPTLAPHVQRLVAGIRYGTTEDALRVFADDVAHPTCDFVVAALITATQHQARDVAQLLTHLSECAREECRFHLRMWVSRARVRTATRLITGVVVLFVSGLLLLDPGYLRPFVSFNGAMFLGLAGVSFGGALFMLHRLAQMPVPARFLSQRSRTASS